MVFFPTRSFDEYLGDRDAKQSATYTFQRQARVEFTLIHYDTLISGLSPTVSGQAYPANFSKSPHLCLPALELGSGSKGSRNDAISPCKSEHHVDAY